MAWQTVGRCTFYTRSRKVGGRVVREYCGTGLRGTLAAETDDCLRRVRDIDRRARRLEHWEMDDLDERVGEMCERAELVATAVLLAAGYHKPKGRWRRRRVREA